VTAAADLCRGQLGSPSVGILLEGRVPWLVSRGVPASIRGSLARVAHAAATIDAGISATEIGARLAQVLRPIPAQVIAAGRAALVVGITRSETEERLIARVAASVQDAVKTTPADHTSDVADRVDDGLAWTAHEFRAPLGAVRAVLDRLVESGSPKPEDPMLLRRARDEVDRLLEVVDPLLRCAAGEIGESADPVDLESVALDVVDAASGSEDWRDRRFSLQVSGGRLPVRADASPSSAGRSARWSRSGTEDPACRRRSVSGCSNVPYEDARPGRRRDTVSGCSSLVASPSCTAGP
jgi:signal transduction histidine kinase